MFKFGDIFIRIQLVYISSSVSTGFLGPIYCGVIHAGEITNGDSDITYEIENIRVSATNCSRDNAGFSIFGTKEGLMTNINRIHAIWHEVYEMFTPKVHI
jgi:hypothetical protein